LAGKITCFRFLWLLSREPLGQFKFIARTRLLAERRGALLLVSMAVFILGKHRKGVGLVRPGLKSLIGSI